MGPWWLWWAAASSGLDDGLVLVSRLRAEDLPGRLHPLFDPCDQALLDVAVFLPLQPVLRQVGAMPHCDRELREIGDLLPQLREIVVHVVSLQRAP
jgi:hypothetical protein